MSGTTIRELITKWGFEVDKEPLEKLEHQFESLKETFTKIFEVGAEAALSIFEVARETSEAGVQAQRMSDRLGIGIEAMQELQYAAKLGGVSAEEFGTSLQHFNKGLADAKTGSGGAADAFYALSKVTGKNLATATGSTEDKLIAVSEAFSKMTDVTQKTKIAMELFGRSGGNLIGVLSKGPGHLQEMREEARKLGFVLDKEAAEKSEKFEESLMGLFGAFKGLRNEIGVGIMPVITELMKGIKDWILVNREWLATNINSAIKVLSGYLQDLWAFISTLTKSINGIVKAFGGWATVSKVLLKVLIAMGALQLAMFLGQLVMVVFDAIKAFRLLTMAELAANAAALLIPLAIGAAIIALGLIIEDVVAFFQGKDSMLGVLLAGMQKQFPALYEFLKNVGGMIKEAFGNIMFLFQGDNFKDVFKGMIISLQENASAIYDAITAPFAKAFAFIKDQFSNGIGNAIGGLKSFFGFGGSPQGGGAASNPVAGGTVTPAPVVPSAGAQNTNSSQSQTIVQAPITVNVPPGTPPNSVGKHVEKGVSDAMQQTQRKTANDTKPKVHY